MRVNSGQPSGITIASCNVGRRLDTHDNLLSVCSSAGIDILLVQEPWTLPDLSLRRTRSHPGYRSFLPPGPWPRRPRVCTYVSQPLASFASQLRSPVEGRLDLLSLTVRLTSTPLTIWNVYNAPDGDRITDSRAAATALMSLSSFSDPTVLLGDFNYPQASWVPGQRGTPATEAFYDFMIQQGLAPLVPLAPTHDGGHVLDLAFVTGVSLATRCSLAISDSLEVDSDHRTLALSLQLRSPAAGSHQADSFALPTIREDVFHASLQRQLTPFTPLDTHAALDAAASTLTTVITTAARESCKPRRYCPRSLPFWTDECRTAAADLRQAKQANRRSPAGSAHQNTQSWLEQAQALFRKTFKSARRAYYDNVISGLSDVGEVARFTRWRKRPFLAAMPPVKDPVTGAWAEQAEDKYILFHNAFTNPGYAASDLDDSLAIPEHCEPSIEFPDLTPDEVKECCLGVSSTTPGQDAIPVSLLKLAWADIGRHVLELFQACITLGHHPEAFRSARVVIIPKPGNRDKTLPRSYRPISLLSALGKGLERAVARRMARLALKLQIVGFQQCGALPRRSAVDLTSSLVHDVELAWSERKVCSLLTLDIQGAFDAIYPGRLRHRLLEQGWPVHLANWVYSFCTRRSLCYDIDGAMSSPFTPNRGVPQGSPISPILFLLYTAPIHCLPLQASVFGYADDLALLSRCSDTQHCLTELTHDLRLLLTWADDNALSFDPAKSELLHLSRRPQRWDDNPDLTLSSGLDRPWSTTATPRNGSMRWLGVWFDRRLTFRSHLQKATKSALGAAGAIKSLGNTQIGASPLALRAAVLACVLPVLFYAAETWWPVPTPGARTPGAKAMLRHIDRVIAVAARAVLPVWKTTPIPVLCREAGIPHSPVWMTYITRRHALRLHRLDSQHPLVTRVRALPIIGLPNSRLARALELIPETETVLPDTMMPWETRPVLASLQEQVGYVRGSRAAQADKFRAWIAQAPLTALVLYSDGSRLAPGRVGGGWVGYYQGQQVSELSGQALLGKTAEVPDAEAYALLGALLTAEASPLLPSASEVIVCLDNLNTVATASSDTASSTARSAQWIYRQIRQTISRFSKPVRLRWCPGHCNIIGNEAADKEARSAADRPQPGPRLPTTHAAARRLIKEQFWADADDQWTNWLSKTDRIYTTLGLRAHKPPFELDLNRGALAHLLAARSEHGDFAAYHQRFAHEDALLTCSCGAHKTPTHFLYCSLATPRLLPGTAPSQAVPFLLGSKRGAQQFTDWVKSSRFFTDVCPRRAPPVD